MLPLCHRYLALTLCLLALASPACLFTAPAGSEERTPSPSSDGADKVTVILDYSGSLNCESDIWNNENYLETPPLTKD
jgi:hypothetical protein